MIRFPAAPLVLTLAVLATPMRADIVTDSLTAALAAYQAGDLKTTTAQMAAATTGLTEIKTALLAAALPPAPDGTTQEVNSDYAAGIAMMGGGTGVEASYSDASGNSMTVTFTTESPMLAMMMGMFGSPQTLAMLGKTAQVGDQLMLSQDGSLTTVVDGRILVVLNGDQPDALLALAQAIDFAALATFDAPK